MPARRRQWGVLSASGVCVIVGRSGSSADKADYQQTRFNALLFPARQSLSACQTNTLMSACVCVAIHARNAVFVHIEQRDHVRVAAHPFHCADGGTSPRSTVRHRVSARH